MYLTFSVLQLKTYILNREAWDLKTMNADLGGKIAKGKKIHSSLNCSSELISLVITEGGNMKPGEAGLRLDAQGLTTGLLPLLTFYYIPGPALRLFEPDIQTSLLGSTDPLTEDL